MAKTNWWMSLNKFHHVQLIVIWLFFYLLLCFLTPHFSYEGDTIEWLRWANYIQQKGITTVYQSDINYPPVFLYVLWFYQHIFNSPQLISENLIWLKYLVLFFDLLPFLILYFLRQESFRYLLFLSIVLNIGYLHNSIIWGQIDSLPSFFAVFSIFFVPIHIPLSAVLMALALLSKFQVIIFTPLLALAFLNFYGICWKKIIQFKLVFTVTITILLLPFIVGSQLHHFLSMLGNQVGLYPACSLNAFNFWYLVFSKNPLLVMDDTIYIGLSYKTWGLIMFFLFSALILIPYLYRLYIKEKVPLELYFLTTALIVLLFFYFNTEMHERYSYFALLPLFIFAYYSHNWIPFFALSILYFLNADLILGFVLPFNLNIPIFQKTIALLFFGLILYLIFIQWSYMRKKFYPTFN